VLVPAKLWNGRPGDSGYRRIIMMLLGLAIGAGALWLDYGTEGLGPKRSVWTLSSSDPRPITFGSEHHGVPLAAGYLSYFALAFFAMRWWKLADRQRGQRFSLGPILAAGFWTFVLWAVWARPQMPPGMLPLLLAAAIIQLVSPWEPAPTPALRRVRLRYP
jgi:hypothetical protein